MALALASLASGPKAQITVPETASPAPALAEPSPAPAAAADRGTLRLRTAGVVLGAVGGTFAYGRAKWWRDGFTGRFRSVDENWFSRDTQYGGADKLGHAMFAYTGTRLLTRTFEWVGHGHDAALKLGFWTSVGTLLAVEIADGYSKRWRFSKEDAAMNLAGGALGYWMEKNPALDALVDIRLEYSRSRGPEGRRRFDPLGDYSGQRYVVVLKASGVPALARHPLLRYLELNAGYNARDFEAESRSVTASTRRTSLGIALNLSELLRSSVFKDNASPTRTQRLSETLFEYLQIPAAGVSTEHELR